MASELRAGDQARHRARTEHVLTPADHAPRTASALGHKLSMGLDLKQVKGVELPMALWKVSDVWMEPSAPVGRGR